MGLGMNWCAFFASMFGAISGLLLGVIVEGHRLGLKHDFALLWFVFSMAFLAAVWCVICMCLNEGMGMTGYTCDFCKNAMQWPSTTIDRKDKPKNLHLCDACAPTLDAMLAHLKATEPPARVAAPRTFFDRLLRRSS